MLLSWGKGSFWCFGRSSAKGTSSEESLEIYSFYEKVGLPITLAEIGIDKSEFSKLELVAEKSCATGEYIHHEAGEMTPERVFYAILAADALGSIRKGKG